MELVEVHISQSWMSCSFLVAFHCDFLNGSLVFFPQPLQFIFQFSQELVFLLPSHFSANTTTFSNENAPTSCAITKCHSLDT